MSFLDLDGLARGFGLGPGLLTMYPSLFGTMANSRNFTAVEGSARDQIK